MLLDSSHIYVLLRNSHLDSCGLILIENSTKRLVEGILVSCYNVLLLLLLLLLLLIKKKNHCI